jgi:hypothetical protein
VQRTYFLAAAAFALFARTMRFFVWATAFLALAKILSARFTRRVAETRRFSSIFTRLGMFLLNTLDSFGNTN